jgi:tRNA(fMet)-specific endonuclease VapC
VKYILDTNICIYIIKKKPEKVLKKLIKIDPSQIAISSITWCELVYGAEKSQHKQKNLEALKGFIVPFEVLPFTETEAALSGKIRAQLEAAGKPIDPYDLLIAAHACSLELTLVTNNEKEFNRVSDLKIENWAPNF